MKFLTILSLATAAQAGWTFTYSGGVKDGSGNKGCTKITHKAGREFNWDRSTFSSCCIRLYSDSSCKNQVGYSCPDWKKVASRDLNSFKVTSC
jgi:hypothetical protein